MGAQPHSAYANMHLMSHFQWWVQKIKELGQSGQHSMAAEVD